MGKIGQVIVRVDGNKEVYRAGEEVRGVWEVTAEERVTVNAITTSFHGQTYVKWTETATDLKAPDLKFITREHYTNQFSAVDGGKLTLERGIHKYPFKFVLPKDKMPSSFEGRRGCTRYWLSLKIERSLPWRDVERNKCITFLDDMEINLQCFAQPVIKKKSTRLSKILGFGDAGEVTLDAKINRKSFCPGEAIAVTVNAKNNSQKDLGKIKASLIQSVKYLANGSEKTEETCICTKTGTSAILKGQSRSWMDQLLSIDAVPPSTRMRASFSLMVSYFVKVYIDISFLSGGDLVLNFPVTIGTVPQGYKKPTPTQGTVGGASNIPVVDLTNTLTHTRCNRGWEKFNRSTDDAIPAYVSYTPMCVYVANYQCVPRQSSQTPWPADTATAANKQAAIAMQTAAVSKPTTPTSTPKTKMATTSPAAVPKTLTPARVPSPSANRTTVQTPSATGQGRLVAAAPPFPGDVYYDANGEEESPPSYSELFGDGDHETNLEDEDSSQGKVFLLVRFPAAQRQEFIDTLHRYSSGLQKCEGYLSALQDSLATVSSGTWDRTSLLGILTFTSEDQARDWLKVTPDVCHQGWLGSCDILLIPSAKPFQEDHQVLTFSNRYTQQRYNKDDFARFKHILNTYTRPVRLRLGGVCIASSMASLVLRGHWELEWDKSVVILTWPSISVLKQYIESIDPDIYREYQELRVKLFPSYLSVVMRLGPLSLLNTTEDDGEAS